MHLTYDELDKIREINWISSLINVKERLTSRKTEKIDEIRKLWLSHLKNEPDSLITLYVHTPFCLNKRCNYCLYTSTILTNPKELDEYLDKLDL
jgi:coproporphyrinogen III oxidase-like Fe-S oxidoreductase